MAGINVRARLLIVVLSTLSWAAMAALPFTVRLGATGDIVISMDPVSDLLAFQFGYRDNALVGLDINDIPTPPQSDPGGTTPILYFTAADPITLAYSQDFRPPADSQTWELNLLDMSPGRSVTLHWRLQDGSLDGTPLSIVDRDTGAVLVADMTITTSLTLTDENAVLHILYGAANHPPVPKGDEAFMLAADGSIVLPFDFLLANDTDPEKTDTLEITDVGLPALFSSAGKAGTTAYGTTTLDTDNRQIIYSLPTPLPGDWDGDVVFEYTVSDDYPLAPLTATATVVVTVADDVVQDPDSAVVRVKPGTTMTLSYTLRYSGVLHSLAVEYTLPFEGPGVEPRLWQYAGNYSDDDDGVAAPVIDDGAGDDGIYGTGDDTGLVRLDFGTDVPDSGTRISFDVTLPAGATSQSFPAAAFYRLTGVEETAIEQRLQPVAVIMLYTASFLAEAGGSVDGSTPQDLEIGTSTTPVTAVPDTGYSFVEWTSGGTSYSTDNPVSLLMGAADVTLTAHFLINSHTITFAAGPHGALTGASVTPQTVDYGGACTAVEAVADTGYHFVRWLRNGVAYSTDNPVTVTNVTADATFVAEFGINVYTVKFLAGANGSISGSGTQSVNHGGATTSVRAVPDTDYSFVQWSDGSTVNPRTISNVTEPVTVTAEFVLVIAVEPDGEFVLGTDDPTNPEGRLVFDLTGTYVSTVGAYDLMLEMGHDEKGTVTGIGRLSGMMTGGTAIDVPLAIKGKAKGKGGIVSLKLSLASTSAEGNTTSVKIKLPLTLAGGQLTGVMSAKISDDVGGKESVSEPVEFDLPAGMDGSISITVDLALDSGKIVGDAWLVLSNDRVVVMVVKGKVKNGVTQLSLAGDKTIDPLFGAVKFKLATVTFSNGTGYIVWMKAKAFGQSIAWP